MSRFLKVQNKVIRLDSISYVDFLDNGRAMVFMRGLSLEKQNIALDADDARKLRAVLEADCVQIPK